MKLSLEIPIIFINTASGAKRIVIDPTKLIFFLDLNILDTEPLIQTGLMEIEIQKTPKQRINYKELALSYQKKLEQGEYANKAELARSMGVSRAWITKVFKRSN